MPKGSVGLQFLVSNNIGLVKMYHICNKIEMFLGHNKKFIDFDDKSKAISFAKYPNFYQNCFA